VVDELVGRQRGALLGRDAQLAVGVRGDVRISRPQLAKHGANRKTLGFDVGELDVEGRTLELVRLVASFFGLRILFGQAVVDEVERGRRLGLHFETRARDGFGCGPVALAVDEELTAG
jgi:hypothetical protein